MLRSHVSQTDLSVCTCNENIFEILLCEDDQDTVLIQVYIMIGNTGIIYNDW